MSYRIPSEDVLERAMCEVLAEHQTVSSQSRLLRLVTERLLREDDGYRLSGERMRRFAILRGLATVEIKVKDVDERSRYGRCPVCTSKMARIKNMTIYDGTVTNGYRCPVCGYWTGMKRRVPTRYVFHVIE